MTPVSLLDRLHGIVRRWIGHVARQLPALLIAAALPTVANAAVTTAGDVTLQPTTGTTAYIGENAYGSVAIDEGSALNVAHALTLGKTSTATGVLDVSGPGSQLQMSTASTIGDAGLGLLSITNGGRATLGTARVGRSSGGYGEILVDGATSSLSIPISTLTIAGGGTGTGTAKPSGMVVAANGARVETGSLQISEKGAKAAIASAVARGRGTTWINRGQLSFGYADFGSLEIRDGATFLQLSAINVSDSTVRGQLLVTGQGSFFSYNSNLLAIGTQNAGSSQYSLDIEAGGAVSGTGLTVGASAATATSLARATVTVTGPGSQLTLGSTLVVQGNGALAIREGGRAVVGAFTLNSGLASPAVSIQGLGSSLIVQQTLGLALGAATLSVADGGVLDFVSQSELGTNTGTVIDLAGGEINLGAAPRGGIGILTNRGILRGTGVIGSSLSNQSGARVVVGPGQALTMAGGLTNLGNLEIDRGVIRFGTSTQSSSLGGTVKLNLGDTNAAFLQTSAKTALTGSLAVTLADGVTADVGDSFALVSADLGVTGKFASTQLPDLAPGLSWFLDYQPTTVSLHVVSGDFDGDALITAVDLAAWQTGFGATSDAPRSAGDANGDGAVTGTDFLVWQRTVPPVPPRVAAVAEPSAVALASVVLAACAQRRSRRPRLA